MQQKDLLSTLAIKPLYYSRATRRQRYWLRKLYRAGMVAFSSSGLCLLTNFGHAARES